MSRRELISTPDGAAHTELDRKLHEEATRVRKLEDRLRNFFDRERPAYDRWMRIEFGAQFSSLDEIAQEFRERLIFARRVEEFKAQGYLPREALYLASQSREEATDEDSETQNQQTWDRDEIEARRDAKKQAKREARKTAKKQEKRNAQPVQIESRTGTPTPQLTTLYRLLARRLHPDSTEVIADANQAKLVWTEVQIAYRARDLDRLVALATWLGPKSASSGLPHHSSLSQKSERLRTLARARAKLEKKLALLEADPAWEFEKVQGNSRHKKRQAAAREMEDRLAQAQDTLDELESYLESMGPPRKPSEKRRKK